MASIATQSPKPTARITIMKTTPYTLFTTAIIGLTLAACAAPEPSASTPSSPAPNQTQQVKTKAYPLDTCIVTDNDLDSMGGEIVKVYDGQQIKFCCKPCVKKFEANQPKYLKKIK